MFYTSQVVQDFVHQQYVWIFIQPPNKQIQVYKYIILGYVGAGPQNPGWTLKNHHYCLLTWRILQDWASTESNVN